MSPSEIFLPRALPYPIKVLSFNVQPQQQVHRQAALLNYSFAFQPTSTAPFETRIGTWESHVEGVLEKWLVTPGQVVVRADRPVVLIEEPCKHPVQSFGLCGLCGKDMTEMDYTGFADADRASIQMDYSSNGPTLSVEEATRIERETSERLLKARKLHLIVDLDQTIVHATVDPTVGEWMAEGEPNANWEALKDVRKFQLLDSPAARGHEPADNCWYYIKPRPGLDAFLTDLAEKYEMHVYTMGTRAYADRVCKAIDPSGKLFAGRILSRDESGSIAKKRLQRLFPSDQSMVVIIDDRADVWDWCPNLVKVIPFEFFVGIGDINSAFLPKVEPLVASAPVRPSKPRLPSAAKLSASTTTSPPEDEEEEAEDPAEAAALLTKQSRELEAQLEDRPLAKKQEELTHASSDVPEKPVNGQPQHPLLTDSDRELERVKTILDYIHQQFYKSHDATLVATVKAAKKTPSNLPNVMFIIPKRMAETFRGKHFVFSSVIPLGTNPEHSDIWRMARSFGAECHAEVTNKVTHVIAAKRGTVKVDEAYAYPHIAVVWLKWFTDSVGQWECLPETDYLLDPLASSSSFNGIRSTKRIGTEQQTSPQAVAGVGEESAIEMESGNLQSDDPDSRVEPYEAASPPLLNVSWTDMDKEVDEYLAMDSDEDEDEATLPTPPRASLKRVRSRSGTPVDHNGDDDLTRSPLAKRKKLAADRPSSMLKKEILSNDTQPSDIATRVESSSESATSSSQSDPDDDASDKNDTPSKPASVIEDEDDFLLRDLQDNESGWG